MPESLPVVTPEFHVGQFVRYVVEGPIVALVKTPDGVGVVLKIGGAEGIVLSGRQLDLIRQGPDPRDAENERLRVELALAIDALVDVENGLTRPARPKDIKTAWQRFERWHQTHGGDEYGDCPYCVAALAYLPKQDGGAS